MQQKSEKKPKKLFDVIETLNPKAQNLLLLSVLFWANNSQKSNAGSSAAATPTATATARRMRNFRIKRDDQRKAKSVNELKPTKAIHKEKRVKCSERIQQALT